MAHQGAAEYINDHRKSFLERYSDLLYLAVATLGIIGSIFAGLYTKVTRIAPEKASELATAILDIGERTANATTMEAVDRLQDELETNPAKCRDRTARRHHLQRWAGYVQARL
ncbi:MAG: hypothetical protein WDN50_24975 [Bradyrhizobium sp.]